MINLAFNKIDHGVHDLKGLDASANGYMHVFFWEGGGGRVYKTTYSSHRSVPRGIPQNTVLGTGPMSILTTDISITSHFIWLSCR